MTIPTDPRFKGLDVPSEEELVVQATPRPVFNPALRVEHLKTLKFEDEPVSKVTPPIPDPPPIERPPLPSPIVQRIPPPRLVPPVTRSPANRSRMRPYTEQDMAELRELANMGLKHNVFNPSARVHVNLMLRLALMQMRAERDFRWVGSCTAPNFTDDPEVVVILYATLGTLEQTAHFYWNWASSLQESFHKDPTLGFDPSVFRLWNNVRFEPWTMRWLMIKLNDNFRKSPANIRTLHPRLPGPEVLAVLAEHPERVKASNGTEHRPYLWMAGIETSIPDYSPVAGVPLAWFDQSDRRIGLDAGIRDSVSPNYAVPVFAKSIP